MCEKCITYIIPTKKTQPGSQLAGGFNIFFCHFHHLQMGNFSHFDAYFFGEWVGSTTNVTSEAWVASEVRMPVVKMEMEPQKVALEDEDLRFSRFFLWGDFLFGAFFGY